MEIPEPKFKLDEIVAYPAFTDCFGKFHPRVELLRVIEVNLANPLGEHGLKPYWRVKATPDAYGLAWFEGAERYFEKLGG